ncbi:MAG: helix-turn-helix domain-containing protein [Candidatus Obscuribacterales bacterium]|nr:helix-turn-helix domain-containing protein [Candidatus Obscuribacterales bacterium]
METIVLKKDVEPLLAALGRVIRERRVALGLSQGELAEKAGLHRTYVSDIERGIRNLTVGALCFLANGLDTKMKDLIDQMELQAESFEHDSKMPPPPVAGMIESNLIKTS